ncbi:hypothetical protein AbraIFM66951_002349 [Aspergillus brasiliensis]|nr:hypothetical protein AbraIFM66951_002349 [Aspergillus brasiliensis]
MPSDLRRAMVQLGGRRTLEVKKSAIKEILGAYDVCPLSHEHLSFYFRRQPAATVWTEGVFSRNSAGPSLAYVTFDGIQSVEATNNVEDPYIMGILIALAQEQWRHSQRNEQHGERAAECSIMQHDKGHTTNGASAETPTSPRCGTDRSPHDRSQCLRVDVLATSGIRDDYLYVYTAFLSVAFLKNFDEPWRSSPSFPVVVEYHPISLRSPIKSLNKLHRVLCAESCRFCAGDSTQALG